MKKFIACIVSFILLVPFEQWVIACGGGDEEDYYSFFIDVNTANTLEYSAFQFSYWVNYFGEAANVSKDYNIGEWQEYCGKAIESNDIYQAVYRYHKDTLQQLYSHIKNKSGQIPVSIAQNTMVQWLVKKKDLKTLDYILYAKGCEVYSVPPEYSFYSPGDNQPGVAEIEAARGDTTKTNELIAKGIEGYEHNKGFLKWRYAYQVIKLAFYSGQYDRTLELYESYIGDEKADDFIKGRCIGLKAGALYALERKAEAAYWYSIAYELSDEMKIAAVTSFNWATKGVVDEVLHYCKTDHEKAVVYVMDGLHQNAGEDDGKNAEMEEAYRLDPKIRGLDVLMTRRITMLESDMQSDAWDDVVGDSSQTARLRRFAERVATEGKAGNRAFWYMAAAYTCVLEGNMPEMKRMMEEIEAKKMNEEERDLHNILSALYTINTHDKITPALESELLPMISRIEQKIDTDSRYENVFRMMVNSVLAEKYIRQDEMPKAIFLLSRTPVLKSHGTGTSFEPQYGYYYSREGAMLNQMSIEELKRVQAFLTKKDKTPFEEWLVKGTQYNYNILRELEGTKYLRENRYAEAEKVFSELPEHIRGYSVIPNVFAEHIKDQQDLEAEDSVKFYSKLSFATAMKQLQQKVKAEPANAPVIYKYACALYNTTYYGRAWFALSYYRSGVDERAYAWQSDQTPADEYYDAYEAEKYFLQAYQYAKNEELKAKCLFMAAKCWQKRAPYSLVENNKSGEENYYYTSLKSPHFKELKQYRNTKFYKQAYNTCSYLRDYVKKQ